MSNVTLHKWRIYCETENAYQYIWSGGETGITQCPNNAGHTVTGTGIAVDSARGVAITPIQSPYIYNNKSILADTSTGNIQINMLKAGKQKGKVVIIKKKDAANTLFITPFLGDSIAGSTNNYSITDNNAILILQSDGISNWSDIGDIYYQPDTIGIYNNSNLKGDMFVDTGYEISRLPIGSDNSVLCPDSTTNLGVAWKSFNTFIPNSLFATSFNRSNTQVYTNIATLTDTTICVIGIPSNPPKPTQLTVVACMNSTGATGTISFKESSSLNVLSTITVNSVVITPTRYTATITNTSQTLFLLTVKNTSTSTSRSVNVYSVVIS